MKHGPGDRQGKWRLYKTEAVLRLRSYHSTLEDCISWWGLERGMQDFRTLSFLLLTNSPSLSQTDAFGDGTEREIQMFIVQEKK